MRLIAMELEERVGDRSHVVPGPVGNLADAAKSFIEAERRDASLASSSRLGLAPDTTRSRTPCR
jgi:hypothetical protein